MIADPTPSAAVVVPEILFDVEESDVAEAAVEIDTGVDTLAADDGEDVDIVMVAPDDELVSHGIDDPEGTCHMPEGPKCGRTP